MQKAFIIMIMVIFIVTSIGFFVAMMGPAADPEQREQQERQDAASPDIDDASVDFEIPEYVTAPGVNFDGAEDLSGHDEIAIDISDNVFSPTATLVSAGVTVEWVNSGDTQHSIVSDPDSPAGEFASGLLDSGESFTQTFDEPGEYYYFCEQHPASMRGVLLVE